MDDSNGPAFKVAEQAIDALIKYLEERDMEQEFEHEFARLAARRREAIAAFASLMQTEQAGETPLSR